MKTKTITTKPKKEIELKIEGYLGNGNNFNLAAGRGMSMDQIEMINSRSDLVLDGDMVDNLRLPRPSYLSNGAKGSINRLIEYLKLLKSAGAIHVRIVAEQDRPIQMVADVEDSGGNKYILTYFLAPVVDDKPDNVIKAIKEETPVVPTSGAAGQVEAVEAKEGA
jgi:hypothetical protein